ncbi:MAG: choice-of-anchor A family protein [Melioribacteraceae bacterium]|nr:choice-of-anchor A family protein [Melioribacteraceae bacterium]
MKKNTLLGFLSIIFLSLLFVGQAIAKDKDLTQKNIGKFTSISENGNVKDIQGTSTATVLSTDKGADITFSDSTPNEWAGTINATVDGSDVKFYCIDIGHLWATGTSNPYTDEGSTSAEITYILNNYYPYVPYNEHNNNLSEKEEAAAVQAAVWHYSDGVDVSKIDNSWKIKNRAKAIVEDADDNAKDAYFVDYFTITPATRNLIDGQVANFVISAFDINDNPFAGLVVDLSTSSGTLSAAQVTTDANGEVSFTLTQDGGNIAEITATAQAVIPHGTQYFHIANPETTQKMVLATPTIANASASADVTWYTPGDCDLENYTTYTQGGWGGKDNSGPGKIRKNNFEDIFPHGLTIGGDGSEAGKYRLLLENSDDVKDFLPAGGTSSFFTDNYKNPEHGTSAGVLAGQLVAVTLNVYFHDAGKLGSNESPLGGLVFDGGDFDGMSIYDFLALANKAIGGDRSTGYSYSEFNEAATAINENFDDGKHNKGDFTCGGTIEDCKSTLGDFIWHDSNVNGIQDDDDSGIENVVVELYKDGSLFNSTSTDETGYYEFTELLNGTYTVKVADANFGVDGVFEGSDNEKWYLTYANKGTSDELDSDGDENNSATVTIDCEDNPTVDFGFFHTAMTFEKTGPASVIVGDLITYTFTVVNTGDLKLAGGASVYDPMLSNENDDFVAYSTVEPGSTWTFPRTYPTSNVACGGNLVNNAWAIGRPQMPDDSYKESLRADDSHTVEILCAQKASLGDRVWYDDDKDGIQDLDEEDVNGVTVNLYNCSDDFVSTTTTNSDGNYLFEDLEPGSYYVEFVLPNGYLFTTQNEGTDSSVDSDADVNTGKTTCVTLVAGDNNLSLDAGMYTVPTNDFDLSIVKTASNATPDDEEVITYTITVTNNSATNGTGITVTDVLPTGLDYISSTPAGYDELTGIWTVGDLNAGDSKSLTISVKVNYLAMSEAPTFDFGAAAPYNLFVIKDVVQPSSDTEGKVAVGRNATFGNYSVGDKLNPSGGTEDVLIVGRKLTYTSGQVYNGNAVYGKYKDISQMNLCRDGSIRKDSLIDFDQAEIDLNSLSSLLAAKDATGTTTFEWNGLTLNGTEPILNVFEVDGNDLSTSNSMEINVPNGSVVLVNVNRGDVSWGPSGVVVNGTAVGNVLYNFHAANKLKISGIDIRGSVLAPKARVNFVAGVINGQMICKFFEGQGQMNLAPFHGNIYGNPEITNCAEINGFDQVEVDGGEANNLSCAPIVINVEFNPDNGDDSETGNNWVAVGGSGLSEMIWSMYQSNSGLLVGTVGGNIYHSDGMGFTLLNEGMSASYIWSLYEFDGNLFAATERGLYKQDGSDWVKVAIDGDVRSITSIGDNLYAAVWGVGVFSSDDNGDTWTVMNEGLIMSGYAVQSLTVANGNLFVGTFGLGVLRFDFDNNVWVELPVGYTSVWSIAADANDVLYAATSGAGVYASTDNGESWGQINIGLPNMFVYSVSVYGERVYVSTWAGGVYSFVAGSLGKAGNGTPSTQSAPLVGSWTSLGMGGIEVSSIMVDESTQTIYAGTSSGAIYKKVDGITDVNPIDVIPTEFELEQNYPNPFNPSTKIEFSIAEAGLYAVKVFNVLGQEVATIANQDFSAGKYSFSFEASHLTSGIYFYKLVGENVNITKKMMLLK